MHRLMKHFSNILYKFINSNNLKICIHMIVEHLLSPPLQHLRYKMIVKLMAEESSATDPTTINLSDYSSISSSEGDYTDTDIDDDYFLFQNVRKLARRKRRKMPPEEYKKTKEKKKLIDYESESDTSSSDGDYFYNNPSQPYSEVSLHYIQGVPEKQFLRENLKNSQSKMTVKPPYPIFQTHFTSVAFLHLPSNQPFQITHDQKSIKSNIEKKHTIILKI